MPGLILGFVVGRGPLAALITDEEREDVVKGQPEPLPTHVYVRAADDSWSLEAVFPRLRPLLPGGYGPDRLVREYILDLPEPAYRRVHVDAGLAIGQRYSLIGLFICWLYLERRWAWAGARIPWKFCSQIALELLHVADIEACPGLASDDVSPAHLEGWLATYAPAQRVR